MKESCAFEITCSVMLLCNKNDTLISFYESIIFDNPHKQRWDYTEEKKKKIGSKDFLPFLFTKLKNVWQSGKSFI